MKSIIDDFEGMPVEIPFLDEQGEQERILLNELALREYNHTGTLSSVKLQEANEKFLESAKNHILLSEKEQNEQTS